MYTKSGWNFLVTPENFAIFTGTTFKPSFCDSSKFQIYTKEKGKRREESGGEKKTHHPP